jgi:hypothetical protein
MSPGPAQALRARGRRALVKAASGLLLLVGFAYLCGLFLRVLGLAFELGRRG